MQTNEGLRSHQCSDARAKLGPRIKLIFSIMALLLTTLPASAQSSAPTDIQELRRSQQREEEEHQRKQNAPDVRLQKEQPLADTLDLPQESPCFLITSLQLEGDGAGRFSWAREYVARYNDRCIGREGINVIVKRLSSQLISRGYITTRIGVPEQDLSAGTLRLVLVPGVLRSIYLADEKLRGSWKTAFPARPGDLLNIRDLDQGLEQMKRVPYQDAELEIKPGELPGESDVIITVKREKFWRGSISLDDAGSKTTGKLQATAGLSLDNPLGLNDLFALSGNHDAARRGSARGTKGGGFSYSLPFGYWTSTLTGSVSDYHQTVAGQVEDFMYRGKNTNAGAEVQRLIHRDQVSKTSLQFGIAKRKAKTYLNDVEIEVQRREVTAADISLNHRRYFGKTVFDLNLAHRQGMPWLHAQPDLATSATSTTAGPSESPTTRYKIQTLDLSVNAPFQLANIPMRCSSHVRGQYTKNSVFISEQFSIGSRYTVRGFDGEQTLLAERGWFMRNEIGIPVFRTGQEFYAGIDHGEVSGPSSGVLAGKQLTGSVVGLRGGFKGFTYDAFAGWPLSKPGQFKTKQPATGFQMTYQF